MRPRHMRHRDYLKILIQCDTDNGIDRTKIAALPDDTKAQVTRYCVRTRTPIIVEFILPADSAWLDACGYLYTSKNRVGYTLRHTCEQRIV